MTKAVQDAIDSLREDPSILEQHPFVEAALREAVTDLTDMTDDRGEISIGALRGKFGKDGVLEVQSRKLKNVLLNWDKFVEFVYKEGSRSSLADAPWESHPDLYFGQIVLKALGCLVGARNIDLGPGSSAAVHYLWISRKGHDTVTTHDVIKAVSKSMPQLEKKDIEAVLENLAALGIVRIEGRDIHKCDTFVLVPG